MRSRCTQRRHLWGDLDENGSEPMLRGSPDHYRPLLNAVDPLADAVAAEFARQPAGRGRLPLDTALDKGIEAASEAPQALIDLFTQVDRVPIWLDWDRIERGGAIF